MLNFENLGDLFIKVVQTPEWTALQEKFNWALEVDENYIF